MGVLVDVGYKSEGLIPPLGELSDAPFDNPEEIAQVGEEIKVSVLKLDTEGSLLLSKRRADQEEAWEILQKHYENAEPIDGKVIEVVRGGGLIVYLGLRAFMPASQVGLRYEADLSHYVGQTLRPRLSNWNLHVAG